MWSKLNQPLWIRKCIVLIQLVSNTHWLLRHSSEWRMYQRDKWVIISQRACFTLWCKLEAGVQCEYIQNGKVLPWINLCIKSRQFIQSDTNLNSQICLKGFYNHYNRQQPPSCSPQIQKNPFPVRVDRQQTQACRSLIIQTVGCIPSDICLLNDNTDIKQKKHIVAKQMQPASCVGDKKKNKTKQKNTQCVFCPVVLGI